MHSNRPHPALLVAAIAMLLVMAASGLIARDLTTWALEVAPVAIAVPLLAWSWRRHPLTPLLYCAIGLQMLVLVGGGITSYAEQPIGFWLRDLLGLERNPYDRIGHFMQGVVPALATREVLLRGSTLARGKLLGLLSVCVALAVSATYELVEWGAAVVLGQGADEFLGTQGDIWDTQADMGMAMIGALVGLAVLAGWHDRQIAARGHWNGHGSAAHTEKH